MGFGIAKHGAARVDQVESFRAKAMDTKATAHTTLTRALGSTAPVSLLNPQLHPKARCRPEGSLKEPARRAQRFGKEISGVAPTCRERTVARGHAYYAYMDTYIYIYIFIYLYIYIYQCK